MDAQKLISLVVREVNDEITVRDYGHGFLMTLPLTYWDDDRVTLFVEPFESGYRVSDRGSTAVRLHMTGMNVEAPKVAESWRRSVAVLNLFNPGNEDLELAHFTDADQLGQSILKVAEASLRIDQLRWLHSAQPPVRFPDKVVRRLVKAAGERAVVRPNAPMKLRHGRTRQVTAAVGTDERCQVYVQAVGGSNRETRERAVEHCTHLFDYADGLDPDRRLAIVSGTREEWKDSYIETLAESTEVAFYGEPDQLDEVLKRRLAPALT